MLDRSFGRIRAVAAVAFVALLVTAFAAPTFASICTTGEGFGSCYRKFREHVGEFPFAVTVSETENRVIVVDLFSGLAYKYSRSDIVVEPTVFAGPVPAPVTYSGIAYTPADQLYWIASSDGGATQNLVVSNLNGGFVSTAPIASPGGGFIGDISYSQTTDTFWGCDLGADLYFEFNPDGTLTGNQFASPVTAFEASAYGTGITVATYSGNTVLDIPLGHPTQLKPLEVRRFNTAGVPIGQSYNLNEATSSAQEWITGIAFTQSGSVAAPTEFIIDAVGNFLYEVPVLPQTLTGVTGLTCTVDSNNNVTLDWTNTEIYSGIRVRRGTALLQTLTPADTSFTDTTADEGAHVYTIQVMENSSAPWTDSLTCTAIVGPGRLLATAPHQGNNPLGMTIDEANDEIYVVDLDGTAHRYDRSLNFIATSPSALPGSVVTGITMKDGDLYWINSTTQELVQTTSANPGPITLIDAVPLVSPAGGDIADLTVDPVTGNFWAIDVSQRIYFEFDDAGIPTGNQFVFAFGEGLGNGITAVGDTGLFDITAGQTGSPIVSRVVRVDANGAIQDSFEYGITPTTQSGFVNGIVYTDDGFDGEAGEYLIGNDTNTLYAVTLVSQGAPFIRGDANNDGTLNLVDVTFHLQFLFGATTPEITCEDSLDVNDNGDILGDGLADVMLTLGFLFMGDTPPPAPFPACDVDPTEDEIGCVEFNGC